MTPSPQLVQERLEQLNARIVSAGRDPNDITIVAVTKRFPIEVVTAALEVGLVELGENYAQELVAKATQVQGHPTPPTWHFVGQLQRNKVKKLASFVGVWQSVDRLSLVAEIAKRAPGATIMVQVNTTAEPHKSGCPVAEAVQLVEEARRLQLKVSGLMTIGPTDGSDPTKSFEVLRDLAETAEVEGLSMGMSGDVESALAAGSTMLRIGTALFGARTQ